MRMCMQGEGLVHVTVSDHLKLLCDRSKKLIVNHYLLGAGLVSVRNDASLEVARVFLGPVGGGLAFRGASQVAERGFFLGWEASRFAGATPQCHHDNE